MIISRPLRYNDPDKKASQAAYNFLSRRLSVSTRNILPLPFTWTGAARTTEGKVTMSSVLSIIYWLSQPLRSLTTTRRSRVQVCKLCHQPRYVTMLTRLVLMIASEASRSRDLAYDYALNTGDDLFLMTLYQWMVQKGKSDQLLEVSNPPELFLSDNRSRRLIGTSIN